MSLSSISIRRPVLAIVLSLAILLFGGIGLSNLGVREYPSVDPPVISVSTNYRGASAEVVESQITEPLEAAVNSVEGIRTLTSVSRDGRSTLQVEFQLGEDLERAANDVRDRVFRTLGQLPPDVDPPSVAKADSDSPPIVMLTVRSDQRSLLELSRLADEIFVERLQTIPGVSRIDVWGDKSYAMRLWIDPMKLASYRLSPVDVRDAVRRENVELPAGRIEGQDVELAVRTMSRLQTPEEFGDLILKSEGGRIVRLRDVGRAEIGAQNERTVLKKNGIPMVAVVARPQPGANFVEIVDAFRRRVELIRPNLPSDLTLDYGFDASDYIRDSVREVRQTLVLALGLVVLVIFFFLRDWRTTLVPVVVIPVSLIGTFFVLYLAGFSINILTLLGLVLAIGLVVDDAIVVLENIYAKIERGMDPIQAGLKGTQEIFFAVIATTLALVAVLLPIFFLGGLTGLLFREFGLTLAAAVIISSFVALTLTPVIATRLLKKRDRHSWLYERTEPFFEAMVDGYRAVLDLVLQRRWLAWPVLALCLGIVVLFFQILPQELAPMEDRSTLRISSRGQEGATFAYMDAYMDDQIALARQVIPEASAIITVTSPGFGASSAVNNGYMRIRLVQTEERERSQLEIASAFETALEGLQGAKTFVTQDPTIAVGRRRGLPVQFVLQAPDLEQLKDILPNFLERAAAEPAFSVVDVNLEFDKPELEVEIDRDRARDLGVSALDVGEVLQLTLSEQRLGFFVMDGKQFEVIGQVASEDRDTILDLRNLFVPGKHGQPVMLDKVVRVTEESSPPQLFRFNRYVSATVSAGLEPGYSLADGIEVMQGLADELLDESFATDLAGQSRDFAESSRSLAFVFVLALAMVYLVLSAQFESFRDPFIIMLTVPLALAGALLALWSFGQTLNIFSQIGMIMLIGLVTKNGILIVEFANQRREAGLDTEQAIREAAVARFRPVLMTSISTILGTLPIALALGAGAESRMPMGIAVIGGLLVGTFLTLLVIPTTYTYLAAKKHRVAPLLDESSEASATWAA
ncbi:MAG: efflux RND transporter permease subunit [Thermoanaerobaculia bacterium]|jgi:multidrug efflux pump